MMMTTTTATKLIIKFEDNDDDHSVGVDGGVDIYQNDNDNF